MSAHRYWVTLHGMDHVLLVVSVLVNISIFLATCSTLCTEVCVHVSNSLAVDHEWTFGLTVHVPVLLHVQYLYMYRYMYLYRYMYTCRYMYRYMYRYMHIYMYMYVQCSVYVCVPPCLLSPCVVLALVSFPTSFPPSSLVHFIRTGL